MPLQYPSINDTLQGEHSESGVKLANIFYNSFSQCLSSSPPRTKFHWSSPFQKSQALSSKSPTLTQHTFWAHCHACKSKRMRKWRHPWCTKTQFVIWPKKRVNSGKKWQNQLGEGLTSSTKLTLKAFFSGLPTWSRGAMGALWGCSSLLVRSLGYFRFQDQATLGPEICSRWPQASWQALFIMDSPIATQKTFFLVKTLLMVLYLSSSHICSSQLIFLASHATN